MESHVKELEDKYKDIAQLEEIREKVKKLKTELIWAHVRDKRLVSRLVESLLSKQNCLSSLYCFYRTILCRRYMITCQIVFFFVLWTQLGVCIFNGSVFVISEYSVKFNGLSFFAVVIIYIRDTELDSVFGQMMKTILSSCSFYSSLLTQYLLAHFPLDYS